MSAPGRKEVTKSIISFNIFVESYLILSIKFSLMYVKLKQIVTLTYHLQCPCSKSPCSCLHGASRCYWSTYLDLVGHPSLECFSFFVRKFFLGEQNFFLKFLINLYFNQRYLLIQSSYLANVGCSKIIPIQKKEAETDQNGLDFSRNKLCQLQGGAFAIFLFSFLLLVGRQRTFKLNSWSGHNFIDQFWTQQNHKTKRKKRSLASQLARSVVTMPDLGEGWGHMTFQ